VQIIGGGLGLGALLLLVLLQRYLVARALQPLEQVRAQIAQLQQGQRTTLDAQLPQELQPLVQQINHLLNHTEDTLTRSRNALGNLGHALKTPLAILFSLANRQELNSQQELRDNLRSQLTHMQERISRELGRARLAGEALPGAYFICAAELPDLVSTLAQIHGQHLTIEWSAADNLRLPWDRQDILELLGNLLDNACKWAQQKVMLDITQDKNYFILTIDDDGPGIAPELRAQVLQRGARIDEQIQGHGLGLGIVRDIIEHCKGELSLHESPLGGLQVAIRLPAPNS
jgi:signal transduction histidine kinase